MNNRAQLQHAILVTQLTVAGAVFGFVLGGTPRTFLLLIIPVSSLLLCGRHVAQTEAIDRIRRYLRHELHYRVPGGLRWDWWNQAHPRNLTVAAWMLPMLLTFPGVSLAALVWATTQVSVSPLRYQDLGIWTAVGLDAVATVLSAGLLVRQHPHLRRRRSR